MSLALPWHRGRVPLRTSAPAQARSQFTPSRAEALIPVAQFVYFVFLMMIFIGQQPFSSRNQEQLVAMAANNDGSDIFKQAFFIGFALLLTLLELVRRYKPQYRFTYWPLLLMLGWFLISCAWGVDPFVSFKRAMQQVIVIYITFVSLALLGPERIYRTLVAALVTSLLICWVSLPLTPNAVHPPTESDKALIGAWRGFFFHKNIAGAVMALTFVVTAHAYFTTRKWHYALFSVMAFVFVVGTKSKTSLALCFAILAVSSVYRVLSQSVAKRAVLLLLVGFGMVAFLALYIVFQPLIERWFADPTAFTGRVSIWKVAIDYLADHPYLGSGFGGFWQVGELSPAHQYLNQQFQMLTAHSHNGYLEILVTTGPVGLVLLLVSFVVLPAYWFLTGTTKANATLMASAFAIWSFVLYQNLLETSFFDKDRQVWVIFLSSLAIAHASFKSVERPRWHRRTPVLAPGGAA
ncbi:O-antigen ligase family protein [Sphingomonas psychrotolerans]|uniref:Exopolysaccharide biosynthesis protein n=1 Tax=Sphingomonas psychrotolerans TaxID=1327635 RepID=A0A2K8MFW1_9SPHN|nr:O-antigen ligase family protein [Sphingomonas psychrotolerans]ATY30629.1 exopolysaccharide biosynthesis protein [Sphingomonas psychrotolerans]